MADVKDKIKKLLALAGSSNENEARDALLKAKELMVKNKMTESDFEKESKLVSVECGISWTTDSGDVWIVDLCSLIADEYMCVASWSTKKGSRTHSLVVTGIEDDANLCREVITYAVKFVQNAIKILERRQRSDRKTIAASYSKGFILGLQLAFDEQKEDHPEWGLVVVKPKEVQEYESSLGNKNVKTKRTKFDPLAYAKGQNDGHSFDAKKLIGNAV